MKPHLFHQSAPSANPVGADASDFGFQPLKPYFHSQAAVISSGSAACLAERLGLPTRLPLHSRSSGGSASPGEAQPLKKLDSRARHGKAEPFHKAAGEAPGTRQILSQSAVLEVDGKRYRGPARALFFFHRESQLNFTWPDFEIVATKYFVRFRATFRIAGKASRATGQLGRPVGLPTAGL